MIFKDFIFFISTEFDKQSKDILVKLISLGRGLVYNKISPLTSHIVCNSNNDIYNINTHNFGKYFQPIFINAKWLLECLKNKKLLDFKNYRPVSYFQAIINDSNLAMKNEILIKTKHISKIFKDNIFTFLVKIMRMSN